jgi:septal ring factor EnvC (AmiA/AmiB activator)
MRATGAKDLLTHEEKILSTDFEKNEGRLPWPTERGVITGQYGEHQHPDYKSVTIRNEGVYIATSKGESARSIFKGVVSRVFTIPGENYTVLVKHGEYYTLYHNLINVKVKAGQQVNTKETIGTVFTNEKTRETVLYFQVWKETEKKNPELWLAD